MNRPITLKEEVKKTNDTLHPGKAPGEDKITTEMLQASDEIETNLWHREHIRCYEESNI